jgi:hypothetical protein
MFHFLFHCCRRPFLPLQCLRLKIIEPERYPVPTTPDSSSLSWTSRRFRFLYSSLPVCDFVLQALIDPTDGLSSVSVRHRDRQFLSIVTQLQPVSGVCNYLFVLLLKPLGELSPDQRVISTATMPFFLSDNVLVGYKNHSGLPSSDRMRAGAGFRPVFLRTAGSVASGCTCSLS